MSVFLLSFFSAPENSKKLKKKLKNEKRTDSLAETSGAILSRSHSYCAKSDLSPDSPGS